MTEMYEDGAERLENGLTLPYVWSSLHVNAAMELKLETDPRFQHEVNRFSTELQRLLESLSEVDVARWSALCQAAGFTVFGVVGLSWCKNATTDALWTAWDQCSYKLGTTAQTQRPATLLNPDVLPAAKTLTDLIFACNNDAHHTALVVAACGQHLEIDLARDAISEIKSPELKEMLLARVAMAPA